MHEGDKVTPKAPEDTENPILIRAKPSTRDFLKATAPGQIRDH